MVERLDILGLAIHHLSFQQALELVMQNGLLHKPSYVCFANVHMTIEAREDVSFSRDVNNATLVLADGQPLAVACRILYGKKQERISGMDFMPRILEEANKVSAKIFLYGSSNDVLEKLKLKITQQYPHVNIAGSISPPFGELPATEIENHITTINTSGALLVLVALGCPKQEKWMSAHYLKINAALLGVGGAFAVTAGLHRRSPKWMQKWALEWLYRLLQEPRRMLKRYLYTNTRFLILFFQEWVKQLVK